MIRFLVKGLLRDRSRSLFPFLIVTTGVALTVLLHAWLNGMVNNLVESNAFFQTGHVRVMSAAYAEQMDQLPNDLALLGVDSLMDALESDHPGMRWTERIRFGGLLDIPDSTGETASQGPVLGLAVSLFGDDTLEYHLLGLRRALVRGRLPQTPEEILISDDFARTLGVRPGQTATLISSTMYGSMAMANFTVAGTVRFGINALDRGAMIAALPAIRTALDMDDAAGEILGFFDGLLYDGAAASAMAAGFNAAHDDSSDAFRPVMLPLSDQNGLGELLSMVEGVLGMVVVVFVLVMFMVLWNAGLLGSIRRYGEIGVRLAIGEDKGHLYRAMLGESLLVGLAGSLTGTLVGVALSFYLQEVGLDLSNLLKNASIMLNSVYRARLTPLSYVVGFVPGLVATLLGTAAAGIGIYQRQTSQLFKELET